MTVSGHVFDTVKTIFEQRPMPEWIRQFSGEHVPWPHCLSWMSKLFGVMLADEGNPTREGFFLGIAGRTLVAGLTTDGRLAAGDVESRLVDCCVLDYIIAQDLCDLDMQELHPALLKLITERFESLGLRQRARPGHSFETNSSSRLELAQHFEYKIPNLPQEILSSAEKFIATMTATTADRRVFVTKGGSLGQGPHLMEQGDLVCVINGLRVPFLLRRRVPEGYFLVGECYVDGVMFGEALSKGEEEEITLY